MHIGAYAKCGYEPWFEYVMIYSGANVYAARYIVPFFVCSESGYIVVQLTNQMSSARPHINHPNLIVHEHHAIPNSKQAMKCTARDIWFLNCLIKAGNLCLVLYKMRMHIDEKEVRKYIPMCEFVLWEVDKLITKVGGLLRGSLVVTIDEGVGMTILNQERDDVYGQIATCIKADNKRLVQLKKRFDRGKKISKVYDEYPMGAIISI